LSHNPVRKRTSFCDHYCDIWKAVFQWKHVGILKLLIALQNLFVLQSLIVFAKPIKYALLFTFGNVLAVGRYIDILTQFRLHFNLLFLISLFTGLFRHKFILCPLASLICNISFIHVKQKHHFLFIIAKEGLLFFSLFLLLLGITSFKFFLNINTFNNLAKTS